MAVFYISVIILCIVVSCFAQGTKSQSSIPSTKPDATNSNPDEDCCLKQQALDAIKQEISRAKDYEFLRDRITVWTLAADALWEHDSLEARQLLRDAFTKATGAVAVTSEKDSNFVKAQRNDKLRESLRTDILLVAQNHDVTLVRELIASIEKEDSDELRKLHDIPSLFGSSSFEKRQLASFAAILAKSNPKIAVEYGIESLGFGVPSEFTDVYKSLLQTNPFYAKQLFQEAAKYYLNENSLNLYDGLIIGGYLRLTQVPDDDIEIAHQLLNGALQREKRVWQTIQAQSSAEPNIADVVLATSKTLHGLYETYYPERLGEIESFIRVVSLALSKPPDFAEETIAESKSFNEPETLLEQAGKVANEEARNARYFEAALGFARRGDFPLAFVAASRATDGEKRDAVENYVRRLHAENLINQTDFLGALKVIDKISEPELRAEATVVFARKEHQQKEVQFATQLLIDTQKALDDSFFSISTARAYLWLGSAYTTLDPALGFDVMESAIKRANQTKDLIELNPTPKIVYLGENSNQVIIIGNSKGDFRPGFKILAKQRFVQTLLLAERFENKFFRGIAVITSAAAVLEEESERRKTTKPKSVNHKSVNP